MKNLIFALILPVSALASPLDWRDVTPSNPLGRLVKTLHALAAERPAEDPTPQLFAALPAFAEPVVDVSSKYRLRLTVEERTRLRDRWPELVSGLTVGEPYLNLALAKLHRARDPESGRRPLRMVVRDYYQIAVAKLRRRSFVINDKATAATTAEAISRLETLVTRDADEAQLPTDPTRELLEVLGDLPELLDRVDVVGRYVSDLADLVDLGKLSREYRALHSLERTRAIAEHWPALVAALDRHEAPSVTKTRDRMRGRSSLLAAEYELRIKLKAEGTKAVGGLLGRFVKNLDENLARARAIELRAHRLLRLEEIVRDGARATCADGLERLVERASRPILPPRPRRG